MLQIHSHSTKHDILSHLASVAKVDGDLILEIIELPTFLSSKPAFHIFKFQLHNYPRNIKWKANDEELVQFLLDCEVDIVTHSSSLSVPDLNRELVKFKQKIGLKEVKKQSDIDNTIQNLDLWVEKIETTKHALQQLKQQTPSQIQSQSTQIEDKQSFFQATKDFIGSHRIAQILTATTGCIFILVLAVILFPTRVYTLSVLPLTFEDSITLEVGLDEFTKSQVSLEATGTVRATGTADNSTRPIGRAFLINDGGEDVQLTNGSFRLVNSDTGAKYIHVKDSTQSNNFTISANNSKAGERLEITIEAEQDDTNYNIPVNTRLEVTNLLDQKACINCYALTSSSIKSSETKSDKIVTTADQALLRNNVDSQIAEKRIDEIKKLQESKILTNPNWYKNLTSDYKFSNDIGSQTEEFSLKERSNMDLYSLTEQYIVDQIKKSNPQATNLTDLVVVSSDDNITNVLDKKPEDQKIHIKFFYTYTKQENIDKSVVIKTLSQQQFEDARSDIKKKYPSVREIQRRDMGLNIPGISPRIDVKMNE